MMAAVVPLRSEDDQQRLRQETKISEHEARQIAQIEQSGPITDKRLVREGTEPVYVFEIRGRDGLHLIKIDGITGDVLDNSKEEPALSAQPATPSR